MHPPPLRNGIIVVAGIEPSDHVYRGPILPAELRKNLEFVSEKFLSKERISFSRGFLLTSTFFFLARSTPTRATTRATSKTQQNNDADARSLSLCLPLSVHTSPNQLQQKQSCKYIYFRSCFVLCFSPLAILVQAELGATASAPMDSDGYGCGCGGYCRAKGLPSPAAAAAEGRAGCRNAGALAAAAAPPARSCSWSRLPPILLCS